MTKAATLLCVVVIVMTLCCVTAWSFLFVFVIFTASVTVVVSDAVIVSVIVIVVVDIAAIFAVERHVVWVQEPGPGQIGAQAMQQLTAQRRKDLQKQRLVEYEEAFVALKGKVKDAEGQGMRETIQDKVTTPHLLPGTIIQCLRMQSNDSELLLHLLDITYLPAKVQRAGAYQLETHHLPSGGQSGFRQSGAVALCHYSRAPS